MNITFVMSRNVAIKVLHIFQSFPNSLLFSKFFKTVFASSEPVPGFQGDTLQLAFIDLRQVRCDDACHLLFCLPQFILNGTRVFVCPEKPISKLVFITVSQLYGHSHNKNLIYSFLANIFL